MHTTISQRGGMLPATVLSPSIVGHPPRPSVNHLGCQSTMSAVSQPPRLSLNYIGGRSTTPAVSQPAVGQPPRLSGDHLGRCPLVAAASRLLWMRSLTPYLYSPQSPVCMFSIPCYVAQVMPCGFRLVDSPLHRERTNVFPD